jgi:predicted TIM-barrel fold metal-dependent hydrolase
MGDSMRAFDSDGHVAEPAGLFADWLPDGRPFTGLPPTAPRKVCGEPGALDDQLTHRFDAASYLRAMDAQGIAAAVLYPSVGLFVPYMPELDDAASAAACTAYNEWVAAYCSHDPTRLAAVGVVPQRDPVRAAAEVQRAAALGLVGVLVRPNHVGPVYLDDASYAPLYEALEDTGLVLGIHEALGLRGPTIGADRFDGFAARHMCSHPLEQMTAMVALLLGGVLERHASLRVAFLESGTGWLPYWLARLDDHRDWMRESECANLTLSPSEYFARQCVISSDADDALAAWVVGEVGADHVMWASDFPHPDAHYPDAVEVFTSAVQREGVSDDALRAVMWDTPLRLYRVADRFAHASPAAPGAAA